MNEMIEVTEKEYNIFLNWYKNYYNISDLKIKDNAGLVEFIKDKKTNQTVCSISSLTGVFKFRINSDFYQIYQSQQKR